MELNFISVPNTGKVSDHETSVGSQSSTSALHDSQLSQKEFENLRISVQAKEHFGERMVSLPTRPNPTSEIQVNRHVQSLSSFPNANIPRNNFPPYGRSFSLNEQAQGKQKMSITFKGKDDVIKSYASSWLSDRVVTVETPPASGDDGRVGSSVTAQSKDRFYSPMATPRKDGLYSPMATPHKDGLYSPMGTPVPDNTCSASATVSPANTFIMPKSPVQLSKFGNGNGRFNSPYSGEGLIIWNGNIYLKKCFWMKNQASDTNIECKSRLTENMILTK